MDRKLTLKLDGAIIESGKEYKERTFKGGSLVAELSGVIALPEHYDEREDYRLSKVSQYNG